MLGLVRAERLGEGLVRCGRGHVPIHHTCQSTRTANVSALKAETRWMIFGGPLGRSRGTKLISFHTVPNPVDHLRRQILIQSCVSFTKSAETAAMSRKPSRLEDQLLTARHELELATLLNKGVLHSLQENKITIGELQQENAVLRAAESRLAATEDALESAEKRVRELEREVREARVMREARVVRDGERVGRERAEGELGELRTRYARLVAGLRGLVAVEDAQDADEEDGAGPGPAVRLTVSSWRLEERD